MPEDRHGRLGARKTLAARTSVLEAIEPFRAAFGNAGDADHLGLLLNAGLAHANDGWTSGDDVRLEDFLDATAEAIARAGIGAPLTLEKLIDHTQDALRAGVADRRCSTCTGHEDQFCNGSDRDDMYIDRKGLCLRPYREMAEYALQTAHAWYEAHSSSLVEMEIPAVEFGTRHLGRGPSFFSSVSFFVAGNTCYTEGPSSRVDLVVRTQQIRWACYHACLYVLFHECIAHVFQGLHPASHGRMEARQDDYFTEGWMDWVAYTVLGWTMAGLGPDGSHRDCPWKEGEVLASSLLYHRARSNARDGTKPVEETAAAETGATGAAATQRLLAERNGPKEGWRRFLRLSFDLNLRRDVAEERSRLAEQAYWAELGQPAELVAALDRYERRLSAIDALG